MESAVAGFEHSKRCPMISVALRTRHSIGIFTCGDSHHRRGREAGAAERRSAGASPCKAAATAPRVVENPYETKLNSFDRSALLHGQLLAVYGYCGLA